MDVDVIEARLDAVDALLGDSDLARQLRQGLQVIGRYPPHRPPVAARAPACLVVQSGFYTGCTDALAGVRLGHSAHLVDSSSCQNHIQNL